LLTASDRGTGKGKGLGFGYSCEEVEAAKAASAKLAELDETAVFGHGLTVKRNAAERIQRATQRLAD
jgi:hypothetical protein